MFDQGPRTETKHLVDLMWGYTPAVTIKGYYNNKSVKTRLICNGKDVVIITTLASRQKVCVTISINSATLIVKWYTNTGFNNAMTSRMFMSFIDVLTSRKTEGE